MFGCNNLQQIHHLVERSYKLYRLKNVCMSTPVDPLRIRYDEMLVEYKEKYG